MNNTKHRSPFAIAARLIVLVRPMLPIMLAAIVMGVIGHFCATFITIFGGFALLTAAGLPSPLAGVNTAFVCILVFALLRGVLRYAEQASNHYIAFKLLALIRDKVFGALRRLTPAKLEGRDRGDLISLITADIEQLEVFYAHTISPVCIAILCVTGMTCFTARYHILPALVLLAGYLLVGIALPVWSARRGDIAAREYRQALADTNSYLLESLRGLRDILQYQNTAARAEGITAHSETLGEKQKAMKYREGVTVGAANTLIVLTALAVLGVSIRLYQNGQLGAEGVLVCTLSALSSFGPVVALANLGASLTQVFASADRVLDLLVRVRVCHCEYDRILRHCFDHFRFQCACYGHTDKYVRTDEGISQCSALILKVCDIAEHLLVIFNADSAVFVEDSVLITCDDVLYACRKQHLDDRGSGRSRSV